MSSMKERIATTARGAGAAIRIKSLSKSYGNVAVLKGINLHVEAGEFVTLLGPSGSGKSTLLNIVAGFERPDEGNILVGSRDIVPVPSHKRKFGMVFQSYALFPNMTVAKNVAFPLRMTGVASADINKRVKEVLELLDLAPHVDKFPAEMSGGQQQRVAIARAIVSDPEIILMDEPLSALDKKLRETIQLELKSLHDSIRSTFIFVTHDQSEALTMSDRIAVMSDGVIAQFDTPDEIYRRPANQFVARFVGESNLMAVDVIGRTPSSVTVRTPYGTIYELDQSVDAVSDPHLLVRPENVDLSLGATPNSISAKVVSVVFMGEILRVEVIAQGGDKVLVRTIPSKLERVPAVGELVHLSWSNANCWVIA